MGTSVETFYETLRRDEAWETANERATETYIQAKKYFETLSDEAIGTIQSITTNAQEIDEYLGEVTKIVNGFVAPTPPTVTTIEKDFPVFTGTSGTEPVENFVSATAPIFDEDVPDVTFTYSENEYTSPLLTEINAKLLQYTEGFSTGIDPSIEQAIWDRGRDRVNKATNRAITNEKRMWSASGWDMPAGDLAEKVSQAEQEATQANITESRNIAVAQADLEQKNFQFSFTQAVLLEGQLLADSSSKNARRLEADKYTIQAVIDIYALKVSRISVLVEIFKSLNQVGIDSKNIELKSKQEIPTQIFKTEAEIFQIRMAAETEKVKAQVSELEVAATIFDSEVKGESARVDAEVSVQRNEIDTLIAAANVRVESLKANVSKALAISELISQELQTGARIAGQLAASAISVMNLSDSISRSRSKSESDSASVSSSTSTSFTHIFNES